MSCGRFEGRSLDTSTMKESSGMVSVKEERPDEAEIQALADKMREAHKAKMTALPNQWTQRPGLNAALQALNAARGSAAVAAAAAKHPEEKPVDEESQRGRFGWTVLGTVPIPYILRQGVKYCSVRMVENKVLNKYLTYLHADIYNFTTIRSYYITDAESRLLNEINLKHSDGHYGRDHFTNKDLVVRLQDTEQFYNFLDVCYNRLQYNAVGVQQRCGFIRINNESVVPYTIKENTKYVPLFYFEGETAALQMRAETLEGWDLAYLKFCCKVQGIRNELFASETCSVISLDDIMSYFPNGTKFDDYWPKNVTDCQLLAKNPVANASWTRQPAGAVPAPASAAKPVAPHSRAFPSNNTPPTAGTPGAAAAAALPQQVSNPWIVPGIVQQQQEQHQRYVRALASGPRNWNPNMTGYCHYGNPMTMPQQQPQPQPQPAPQKPHPPPLVRSSSNAVVQLPTTDSRNYQVPKNLSMRGPPAMLPAANNPRFGYHADLMDLSGVQQAHYAVINGRSKNKPNEIPPPLHSSPYTMQRTLVEKKMVLCINSEPYHQNELLMTLSDLVQNFLPTFSMSDVHTALQDILRITLFCANRSQLEVLRQTGRIHKEPTILIQVRDVPEVLSPLRYILEHKPQNLEVAPKRPRIS